MYSLRDGGIYREGIEDPCVLIGKGDEEIGAAVLAALNRAADTDHAAQAFDRLTVGMESGKSYMVFLDADKVDVQALCKWCYQEPKGGDADVSFILVTGNPSECVMAVEAGKRVFVDAAAVDGGVEGVVRVECGGRPLREVLWAEGSVMGLTRAVTGE